jgi:hypothetical protein
MIEELVNGMRELDDKRSDSHYIPEDTFARACYMIGSPMAISDNKWVVF